MAREDAFLDEIVDALEEDEPRLIYADWLEEQGDPRGTFIRVQCELARLYAGDARRNKLRHTEQSLLNDHRSEWIPRLRRKPVEEVTFKRGFPHKATLNVEEFLRDGPALFEGIPTLQSVDLTAGWGQTSTLCSSSSLALPRNITIRLSRDDLIEFSRCEHVRDLRALSLAGATQQSWDNLWPFGTTDCSLEQLEHLDLSRTGIGNSAIRHLLGAPFITKLQSLYLGCTNCNDGGVVGLASRGPSALRSLGLTNLLLQTHAVFALARAESLSNLKFLGLSSNRLSLPAVKALAKSDSLSGLECLDLGTNEFGDDAAIAIADGSLTKLRVLDLRNNLIGDGGALALAKSSMLSDRVSLDLRFNPLSEPVQSALRERFGDHVRL